MNDRFKFRYFEPYEKKIYNVSAIDFETRDVEIDNGTDNERNSIIKFVPDHCLQCTGLKDKNGTLIYEGDIVKTLFFGGEYQFNAKVVWNNDVLCFEVITFDNIKKALGACEEIKVIGNRYENPELLKGQNG